MAFFWPFNHLGTFCDEVSWPLGEYFRFLWCLYILFCFCFDFWKLKIEIATFKSQFMILTNLHRKTNLSSVGQPNPSFPNITSNFLTTYNFYQKLQLTHFFSQTQIFMRNPIANFLWRIWIFFKPKFLVTFFLYRVSR